VIWAQARKLRQLRKGDLLGQMLFNIGGDLALLPGGKAATGNRLRVRRLAIGRANRTSPSRVNRPREQVAILGQ